MPKRRAEVVALKDLSKAVDRAMTLAARRHGLSVDRGNLTVHWEIVGRILRDYRDANGAFQLATDVARGVKLRGIDAQPAMLKLDRDILIGFIERGGLARQLGR